MYKNYPLVMVTWEDHSGDAGWLEIEPSDDDIVVCKTVGFLYKETEKAYYVVNTKVNGGGVGGLSTILKTCVTEFKILRKRL